MMMVMMGQGGRVLGGGHDLGQEQTEQDVGHTWSGRDIFILWTGH